MLSNDVNVIFAYVDTEHNHHSQAKIFVAKNRERARYLLLANVATSFLATYKRYIIDVAGMIESEVQALKKRNSPIKNPSATFITTLVEAGIKQKICAMSKQYAYSQESLIRFKELLLTEFSIPELYFEERTGLFRETFIEQAEDIAVEHINEFFNNFKNKKLKKMSEYKNYETILKTIKMKDYEDKRICAELFCIGQKNPVSFLTFDKPFKKYLQKNGKQQGITVI